MHCKGKRFKRINLTDQYKKEVLGMEKFYFTFGTGQQLAGRCQVIMAESWEEARKKMMDVYGTAWAFQYTEKEYKESVAKGTFTEVPLKNVLRA